MTHRSNARDIAVEQRAHFRAVRKGDVVVRFCAPASPAGALLTNAHKMGEQDATHIAV